MFVVDFQKCRVSNFKFDVLSFILKCMLLSTDWTSLNKDSIFSLTHFDNITSMRTGKIIKQGKICKQINKICELEPKRDNNSSHRALQNQNKTENVN